MSKAKGNDRMLADMGITDAQITAIARQEEAALDKEQQRVAKTDPATDEPGQDFPERTPVFPAPTAESGL